MSRRVVGYLDGRAIWEDLGPATNAQWGGHIGGRAIEEAPAKRRTFERSANESHDPRNAAKGWATRKLRGEGLEKA